MIILAWFLSTGSMEGAIPIPHPTKKGVISGLTLATTAPEIFKSLVEATAFGSKAIFEHYKQHGLQIEEIVSVGGISQKSAFVMQILTDVLGVPVKVANTEQAGAWGGLPCVLLQRRNCSLTGYCTGEDEVRSQ